MSGFVAAAAALRLLPASMGTAVPPQTGLVPGSFGITPEDLKLLADSDSDVEEEDQALVAAAAAVPADAPVPLQRPKVQLDPGPVHKYKWEAVRKLDEQTLVKEAWALDRPAVFCPSFRRLKKKTTVPPKRRSDDYSISLRRSIDGCLMRRRNLDRS